MSRTRLIPLYGVLLVLLLAGMTLWREYALSAGERLLLPLAPVDPRSLMQGDYMRLDYELARQWQPGTPLVIVIDARGIARRGHGNPAALAANERAIFPKQGRIGPDAYFFEEGKGAALAQARFGEFRLYRGELLLVGLADEQGRPLGQRRPRW